MKRKITIIICFILFLYFIGGIFYSFNSKKSLVKQTEKDLVTIRGFDYILKDNDTDVYKNEFNILKKNLESSNINYIEYSISIGKMFLIDLYTLDNKKNKYDVGGVEFVFPEVLENYKLNVENTLYKYIKDNSYNDRNQELPVVKDVKVIKQEEIEYKINDTNYSGYKINFNIEYEKDLGYDTEAEIIIVLVDKYFYIVEKN